MITGTVGSSATNASSSDLVRAIILSKKYNSCHVNKTKGVGWGRGEGGAGWDERGE